MNNIKKYFYPVIAATTLLMAVSCSQDEELIAGKDGDMVTFTINTGEVETRLAGDGKTVNTVHYEVWDKNTGKLVISTIPSSGAMTTARTAPVEDKHATVSMSLVKGVPYDITFWAQYEEASAYDISAGLDDIKLKSGLVCNNEYYDAFFKTIEDFKVKNGSTTVELKRPFAQVNIGTTPADWQRAIDLGVEIDKSTVTVSGIHDQFNARTADATGSTTVTYALNSLINEQFKVKTVNGENEYQYLAMNYMLADPDKTLHNLNVTFKDGEQEINSLSVTNMPIQRNWRTNIVGRVLTSDEDFEIIIVPEFDGDHNIDIWGGDVKELQEIDGKYTVTEASHLAWIAQQVNKGETFNGKTVVLASDIDLNNHVWTPIGLTGDQAGFQGTFDGQDHFIHNLYIDQSAERKYQSAGLFGSVRYGVIKNFTVENAVVKNLDVTSATSCGTAVVVGSAQYPATIENVTVLNAVVSSNRMVGGIAGYFAGTISGCKVEGIELTATQDVLGDGSKDNGDKVGGIMAYANGAVTLTGNEITDFTINAYRDCGGVAGCANDASCSITGNTASDGMIVYDKENAKAIVGRHDKNPAGYETGNSSSNVTIVQNSTIIHTQAEFEAAVANGGTIYMGALTETRTAAGYTWKNPSKSFIIVGVEEDVIIDFTTTGAYCANASISAEFNNVTLNFTNDNYKGFHHSVSETYNNCNINGCVWTYAPKAVFNGCTFNQTGDAYNIWMYGEAAVTVKDCDFESYCKSILIYSEGANKYDVTIENSTFNCQVADGKAAVQMHTEGGIYGTLTMNNVEVSGNYANMNGGLYNEINKGTGENTNNFVKIVDGKANVANADNLIGALGQGADVTFSDDIKISPAGMSNAYGTTGINVKNGQTIDGGGHTLDIKGAGGTWDSGINTTGGLIKDLTVTGSFRGIFINHNSTHSETVVLENVIIDGTTYTISCDQGLKQGLEATGCTFNGWTSYAATLGTAKFTDCNFGEGNGYAYCRPYAPTEFVGCEFEAGFKMDARAKVTFENCTLDGVAITADNLGTLVASNTANATVK